MARRGAKPFSSRRPSDRTGGGAGRAHPVLAIAEHAGHVTTSTMVLRTACLRGREDFAGANENDSDKMLYGSLIQRVERNVMVQYEKIETS